MSGATVTLASALNRQAYGATHAASGIREYAEVQLLTRNIVIQGLFRRIICCVVVLMERR